MNPAIFQTIYRTNETLSVLANQIDKECISKQTITVDSTRTFLTVPEGAKSALITVESSVTTGIVIRYWECDIAPTTTDGIGRGHLDSVVITNLQNLKRVSFIQATAGTHTLQVQYYR